ncbi:MAG: uracil phosphoribosyltransferase [Ignavibacteria bacterium]|nr:uracil phosphoribosyltransferase [Ignavibacteria bacterium]
MYKINLITHPLVEHYLSILRNKDTNYSCFKQSVDNISYVLASILYTKLDLNSVRIKTPLKIARGYIIGDDVVLLPILRAGLGMMEGFSKLYPKAMVSHIGIYRNEKTLQPVRYYFKFPRIKNQNYLKIFVLDPMIATGGSVIYTIEELLKRNCKNIYIVSLLCAPEGLKAIDNKFHKLLNKELFIYTCSVDEKLNRFGYILPGLGDAGDRLFGTI